MMPHNQRFQLLIMTVLLLLVCPLVLMSQSLSSGSSSGMPQPTSSQGYEQNIDPYSGDLKATIPLLTIGGRGSASYTMSVSFESEKIAGSGMYPCCDAGLVNIYDSTSTSSKYYYNRLIRFGAGYGPGVLYATWNSFEGGFEVGVPQTFYTQRRPARLVFADSSGRKHTLQDIQIVGERIFTQTLGGAVRYTGSYNWYISKPDSGKIYRSAEDNGMMFFADGIVTVPTFPNQRAWTDHDQGLFDVPIMPSGTLYMRDGTVLRIDAGYVTWMRDRNGNAIKFFYQADNLPSGAAGPLKRVNRIVDSLGREVTIQYGSFTTPDVINYAGFNATARTIKVQRMKLDSALESGQVLKSLATLYPEATFQTQFFSAGSRYNPEVYSSIEYPDGRKLVFKYDSFGELMRAERPEGSITLYEWTTGVFGSTSTNGGASMFTDCGWQVPDGFGGFQQGCYNAWFFYRRLVKASNYLDASTLVNYTTYSRPESPGDDCPDCVKIETFDASATLLTREKHYFNDRYKHQHFINLSTLASEFPKWYAGLEYKTESFDIVNGTPVLRKTVEKTFTHGPFNVVAGTGQYQWWDGNVDTLYNQDRARVTRTRITLNDANKVSETTYTYDQYLNVTDSSEYDFGSGAAGALLRRTHTDFVAINPVNSINYTDRNPRLISLPSKTRVYSSADNTQLISRTDYEYDNYTSDGDRHGLLHEYPNIVGSCITYDALGNCTTLADAVAVARGNLTAVTSFTNAAAGTGTITTYTKFDIAGNPVTAVDGNGNVSTVEYDDAFVDGNHNTFAFATRVSSATPEPSPDPSGPHGASTPLVSTKVYDYSSGAIVTETDVNLQSTSYSYADAGSVVDIKNRLRKITRPDGGWTTYDYGDDPGNHFLRTQTALQLTPNQQVQDSYQYSDNLGRKTRSLSYNGDLAGRTWSVVDTQYDAIGRQTRVSKPYFTALLNNQIDTSQPVTITSYDGLGRVKSVTTPDAAKIVSAYRGNQTMVTDQAGRTRRSDNDARNRLVKVVEFTSAVADPTSVVDPGAADFVTTYGYNAADNISSISQTGQTARLFSYDSLGRMKTAQNPEDGIFNYDYDNNGNLKSRIDPRGIRTDYRYDGINRLTRLSYSGSAAESYVAAPQVDQYYDGTGMPTAVPTPQFSKGQRTAVKSAVSQTSNSAFDVMGKVTHQIVTVDPGTDYHLNYAYNLAGQITSTTYPSGKIVKTEYDPVNRTTGVSSSGFYYAGGAPGSANAMVYAAHGGLETLKLGNGLWEHTSYNNRLQAYDLTLGTSSTDDSKLHLVYTFGEVVNGTPDLTRNNGNFQSQRIKAPGIDVVQSYNYDYLNRLQMAEETNGGAPVWKQVFKYDTYGNRNFDTGTTTTDINSPLTNPKINPANYHISSTDPGQTNVTYDAGGNLTTAVDGKRFAYDSENRQAQLNQGNTTAGGATYYYDGFGRRAKKVAAEGTTVFVYDIADRLVAEYGYWDGVGGTKYITPDILGSSRAVTDAAGAVSRHDYYPYGKEITRNVAGYGGADGVKQKFSRKERDAESSLDYFGARYYSSTLGRFTTPDEFNGWPSEVFAFGAAANPTFYADLTNPQTLNKYVYANNNPLRFVDPTGHDNFFDRIGRWFWGMADPYQEKPEETPGPFGGLDADTVTALYAMQLGDNGYAAAEMMEALGLDYGITEFSRQMVPVVENKEPDYLRLGLATGTVTANILATGLMWEGVSFENPMSPVNGSSLRGFGPETSWGKASTLEDHFVRHGPDFGSRNSAEYAQEASRFFQRSQMEGLPTKIDAKGTIRVYEPSTNRFGSFNPDGTTKTFYKPTRGMNYWIDQAGTLLR